MLVKHCKFNDSRDLQEVDQFGFIDLNRAFVEGVVMGDVKSDPSQYNNIEDPRSIVGKPEDVFDAMNAVKKYGLVYQQEKESATSEAEGGGKSD